MGLCELCSDSYSKHVERLRTKEKAQSQQQWGERERRIVNCTGLRGPGRLKELVKIPRERARSSTAMKSEWIKNLNLMNKAT